MLFDGRNVSKLARRHIPYLRRRIGVIFQDHRLLSDKRVFDNVALPLMIAGVSYGEIQRRVRAALDKVGLLDKEKNVSADALRRTATAASASPEPSSASRRCCSPDEPTGNLDPEMSDRTE